MQQKWIKLDKSGGEAIVLRAVDGIVDKVGELLQAVADGKELADADVAAMKKRKLVIPE